ncbi:hypothetical protein [Glutamicibacter sp. FBE19]|uniref:hypothetical protein n=1 Tax=Glutamicibacter sp. FBE19 TaxID=2761534 RepID=UPI00189641F1|nr:hypothetical protein [Glutamicibacter sp. FBE19]MBF6671167.1 hypothetical protein [Glutamicibacter sp. FBE19]
MLINDLVQLVVVRPAQRHQIVIGFARYPLSPVIFRNPVIGDMVQVERANIF